MGAETLSSRAIIGQFFEKLAVARAHTWNAAIATRVDSDQAVETLPFLSSAPVFREWLGGRLAKGLDSKELVIPNRHFEATLEVLVKDLRRDRTGQLQTRILDLATRAAVHPQALLSELILNGHAQTCYDGQYFFDTDHAEGDSGSQSNDITVDITNLAVPLAQQGTTTAPTSWALANAISAAVQHMLTFKDDIGEAIHHEAKTFLVMLPSGFFPASVGLNAETFAFDAPNILRVVPYKLQIVVNPRLAWTDKFAVFRTDGNVRALVQQIETEISIKALAEGSDYEMEHDAHLYGIDQWTAVAYGYWQMACRATLV